MAYDWATASVYEPPARAFGPSRWLHVSRRRPCPICERPDWCSITEDGLIACCMRVSEGAFRSKDLGHGTGYFHRISEPRPMARPFIAQRPPPPQPTVDCDRLLSEWRATTSRAALDAFAAELGVTPHSLERLGTTYSVEHCAWAWPMHDDRRQAVGIRLRAVNGEKFAVKHTHAGIFMPSGLDNRSMILICEGPTDTAAALSLGYQAIGRPSCSGGAEYIQRFLQVSRRRDVIIVADSDGPGRMGAKRLADQIASVCLSIRIIAPTPHKDLREWLRNGATQFNVQLRIQNAIYHGRIT